MGDPFEAVAAAIAHALGVDPITVIGFVPLIVLASNLIGRAIPDDAIGWKGTARKIAKLFGLYLSNRVASGVSVSDVAKVAVGNTVASTTVTDLMTAAGAIPPADSKLLIRDAATGQFQNFKSADPK